MAVSFDCTASEREAIVKIVDRYAAIHTEYDHPLTAEDKTQIRMSITACHANGCPLRLADLADADDFNLIHDVGGIHNCISRETGKIVGHFLPRFSQKDRGAS